MSCCAASRAKIASSHHSSHHLRGYGWPVAGKRDGFVKSTAPANAIRETWQSRGHR